jgi:hypothetical protein
MKKFAFQNRVLQQKDRVLERRILSTTLVLVREHCNKIVKQYCLKWLRYKIKEISNNLKFVYNLLNYHLLTLLYREKHSMSKLCIVTYVYFDVRSNSKIRAA